MAKYDDALKLKVVKAYLNDEGGLQYLCDQWGITSTTSLKHWIRLYQAHGEQGLKTRRNKTFYTRQFKLDVLYYYQMSGESLLNVAKTYGISNTGTISLWLKQFREHGAKGLPQPEECPTMAQSDYDKTSTSDQDLQREIDMLRAENAYLKKIQALGRAKVKQRHDIKQKSSKNSDQNTN